MASTGSNKIVSVHSYDAANKDACWLYGNEEGLPSATVADSSKLSIYNAYTSKAALFATAGLILKT